MKNAEIIELLKGESRIIYLARPGMLRETVQNVLPNATEEMIKQATTEYPPLIWLAIFEQEAIRTEDISIHQFNDLKDSGLIIRDENAGDPQSVWKEKES